jgi:superfamily II DNA or RNA helicase
MELTRPCQKRAHDRTTELLKTHDKCILKMFCGTGKSRVIRTIILTQKKPLSIVVFPSLALIRQFTADYLKDIKTCAILNVSSEQLDDFQSTTEPMDIKKFTVAKKGAAAAKMKIVCVTYQSLQVLLDNLGDARIGLACFDEAHRTTSPESVKLVYGDEYRAKYEKQVFFTATPVNANGITMFDRERDEMGTYGDCGPLASEYTYLQGLRDAILSLFELRVDLYTQDTVANMYECIARAILTTGNTRVLTFHADAAEDSKSETSVLRFVDKAKFMDAFRSVCAKEFPDQVGKFTVSNVTFTAITADTKNKDAILGAFETCTDDDIYIVSSCRTIGEGVDTKKANMCVFVDPKSSPKDIIQNIGRICRKIAGTDRQPATVLIPVCIGWDKYVAAGDDAEIQDKLIREQLNDQENGDYNAIMNVCAALKQEDPELYELCLRYPSNFTESERKHALQSQKKRNDPDDYVYGEEIDELVEDGERVEIHTSNVDVPIIYRGFDEEDDDEDERPIQRFYEVEEENEDGEMETRYHRIVPTQEDEEEDEDSNRRLNPPKATNRPRMNIHTNDEIKLIWKIGDVALGDQFGSGVLECQVERLDNDELWMENHGKMCLHIDENGRAPRQSGAKVDPHEKRLGSWLSSQKQNYDPLGPEFSRGGLKTPEIWQIWNDTLEKYNQHLVIDIEQEWKNNHQKMCEFIDKTGKRPSEKTTKTQERILGSWVSCQKNNYDPRGPDFGKKGMKNPEIWQIWTETIANPRYKKELVIDYVKNWMDDIAKVCAFIDKTGKVPSKRAKDPEEKRLGNWVSVQKRNYDPLGSEYSKCIMNTNPEIWQIWKDMLQIYNTHLVIDFVQYWKENHQKMCLHIDKNGKRPSHHSKCPEEKKLGQWLSGIKKNYDPRGLEFSKKGMKNPEIWQIWTDTLADEMYIEVLADQDEIWKNKHKKMCLHIDKTGKAPSTIAKDPEEKRLGGWVSGQKCNYDPHGPEFSKHGMKNPETWQIWTESLEKYSEAFPDPDELWHNTYQQMCEFINSNGKKPYEKSKQPEEKKLGLWISTQKTTYDPRGPEFSKHGMKSPERWQIWTDTLSDEQNSEALIDPVHNWKNNHKKLCLHIDKTSKKPYEKSKDPEEKRLGQWVSTQKANYDPRGPEFSKNIMKIQERWQTWTETLEKYSEALADPVQTWKNNHQTMCNFIDENGRAPRQTGAKDPEEKRIGSWVSNQKKNYDSLGHQLSKHIMKTNPEIWQMWTDTLANEKYSEALADMVQTWKNNHEKMCNFIHENGKAPRQTGAKDPEEKRIGSWVSVQKANCDPRGPEFSQQIMKTNPEIWQIWTDTLADPKYHAALNVKTGRRANATSPSATSKKSHLIPKSTQESLECSAPETNPTSLKRVITDSPYKLTGRAWATQKSCTTHEKLQSNPAEWHAYHAARDVSFQGYVDQSQIPRNRVIAHLGNKRKHRLRILDLGCGRNNIARHFADEKDHKFAIQGYDHVAEEGSGALAGNIADLAAQEEDESADICIYSQSLMGSDWRDYLTEGHRMLRYNGEFIISEHVKMLDDVRAELGRLGCKVESEDADASATDTSATDADDKVPKWFVLVARKV